MIITAKELHEKLRDDNTVIIDVSNKTADFATGRAVYEHGHIPGARFLDIKEDLTGKNSFVPELADLAEKLGEIGVSEDKTIVLYDQGVNRQVAKAFLVLSYIGHEDLYILQGGLMAWVEAGYDLSSELPIYDSTNYEAQPNEELVLSIDDIKGRMGDERSTLIDSRAFNRYTGEHEPKYKKAGHIPGAKHYFSRDVLVENGWKAADDLKEHFEAINTDQEVIVSCGSGNSACLNFVALKVAGYDDVKIYPGGFSEWIEDDKNEVATEEE